MASTFPVVVDSHLRLPDFALEYIDLCEEIFDELTIPNEAKESARRRKQWGWQDLPDNFELFDIEGDNIILPRGYAKRLKERCRDHGYRVTWVDRRRRRRGKPLKLRQKPDPKFVHQVRAIKKMRRHQQGIYQAPTGSGKTVTGIRFIVERSPKRALILVDQISLFSQWIAEVGNWVDGGMCGMIGSGDWVEKRVTVATVQTLWSALKRSKETEHTEEFGKSGMTAIEWFDSFDVVLVDECHHVSADTIQEMVGNFTAKDRIGVSATPDRLDDKFEITRAVLGDVFHEDSEDELRKIGVLVKPEVHAIETGFKFDYWPSHESDQFGNCQVPGCKRRDQHGHKDNYQKLKDKIVADPARNSLVMAAVLSQIATGNHHHLVVSNEVRHLHALEKTYDRMVEKMGIAKPNTPPPKFILTGQLTGKKRKAMIDHIKTLPQALIFATVAKEGTDIPAIDRIYLPFPEGNPKAVQQKIGRGTRAAAGKNGTLVFDFLDVFVPKLKQQFRNRRYKCYDKLGLAVNHKSSRRPSAGRGRGAELRGLQRRR